MNIVRKIFGPSNDELLRQLSDDIGGQFVKGGFLQGNQVQVHYKQWTITLNVYQKDGEDDYTMMRAPYATKDGFRFTIYHKGVFSDLGKCLGLRDVEIGDSEFDKAFIIKGDDETMLRQLFANQKVRRLIAEHPTILLTVRNVEGCFRGTVPVDVLHLEIPGIVMDIERLIPLYDLFGEVLDELCRIGTAHERSPGITL